MPFTLVVADLALEPNEGANADAPAPFRLPAVEHVLRWAQLRPQAPAAVRDWRSVLATTLGRSNLAGVPPARLAASLLDLPDDADPWLAVPVHRTAALDHLRLHPQGVLQLTRDETALVCERFAADFGGQGLVLQPVFGALLLQGSGLRAVQAADPAAWTGRALGAAQQPQGLQARALRALASELELWLHEHAVNVLRTARGALPVNGLWLWGGGEPPEAGLLRRDRLLEGGGTLYANDAVAAALGRLCGRDVQALPTGWPAVEQPESAAVVVSALRVPLPQIDSGWLAPAVAAVDAGRLPALQLLWNGEVFEYRGARAWRFWRRPRSWWQVAP